jgi:hypothetical protein
MSNGGKQANPPRHPVRPATATAPKSAGPAARAAQALPAARTAGAGRPAAASATGPAGLAGDLAHAGKAIARDALLGKRPYLKMAFLNPYNLSLLGGGVAAGLLTANPLLILAALGLEALWLLHAPDSKRLRHLLWDPRFDRLRRSLEAAERAQRLEGLPAATRDRVEALVTRREAISALAAQNPSFTGSLLRGELVKTEKLVDSFIELATTCERYERYLDSVDTLQLDRDRQRYAREAEAEGAHGEIARKNLAVVEKRMEKMEEITRYLSVARGQLDLIENSFQLIADQIVTMQSPQELSGQLDELLDGVEAIRETSRDTERLLGVLEQP